MEKTKLKKAIEQEIEKLLGLSEKYVEQDIGMHEIEKGLLGQLLSLGLSLLRYIIYQKLGQLDNYIPRLGPGVEYKGKGEKSRKYLSLFGFLKIKRPSYWSESWGMFYKLDEHLRLPIGTYWSYNIQELVGENASENDFRESVRVMNKLLDLGLSWKSSERNASRIGVYVEDFYKLGEVEEENSAVCFSASFDGKGVPKIKPAQESEGNPKQRPGKGEKKGIKQMATVSVTSSFTPKQQTRKGIIRALMGSGLSKLAMDEEARKTDKRNDNRWHQNIHRRAFLAEQEKAVDYGIKDISRRMKNPDSRFVVPIDAGIGLEDKVLESVEKYGLEPQFDGIILDIIHVSEYVWNAGTAIFGEKSKFRAPWVREILTDLLDSKTNKVIEELKLNRDKTNLLENKREQIDKTITYFTNHKHKMDYKKFIGKGYPVSSALVESACGHLVKERMEQSGMRWSSSGAQNIMDIRAVKLNDDIENFMDFVIQQDRKIDLINKAA